MENKNNRIAKYFKWKFLSKKNTNIKGDKKKKSTM